MKVLKKVNYSEYEGKYNKSIKERLDKDPQNVDVEMMIEKSTDAKTMEALKKLSETIKYSDPMGNSSVATQEQMIMQYMNEMKISFDSCDMMKVIELCREIELLFIERNKKLMISK